VIGNSKLQIKIPTKGIVTSIKMMQRKKKAEYGQRIGVINGV